MSPLTLSVTLTVFAPPPSLQLDTFVDMEISAYRFSSSVSVRLVWFTRRPWPSPLTLIVSLPSTIVSWVGVRVKVAVALLVVRLAP